MATEQVAYEAEGWGVGEVVIADGRVVARHAGLMSAEQIVAFARQHLAAVGA